MPVSLIAASESSLSQCSHHRISRSCVQRADPCQLLGSKRCCVSVVTTQTDITVKASHARDAAQAALALTDDQMASISTEYNTLSDALIALCSEQKAVLSSTVEVQSQDVVNDQVCCKPIRKRCCS